MATIDLFPVLRSKTRRDILKALMKKEMHISGIAREFGISVPQASKHCRMLEEKGLVVKKTFGRTQVLNANPQALYTVMDYFSDETDLELPKGSNIIDALTQIAGVTVEKADERGFVTSIDGEEGYYIYEVNGRAPKIPMDKYRLNEDSTVELKKILYVKKKRMNVRVRDSGSPEVKGKYRLICVETGEEVKGAPFYFNCPGKEGLVRTEYAQVRLIHSGLPGIWDYIDWLPVENPSGYSEKPVTYRSEALGGELGLKNLYIAFNGYWPERGVRMETCTFKELEGAVTVQYARENGVNRLVVASAGNTAKAFAATAAQEGFQVVLVIPKKCLCGVHLPSMDRELVKTIIVEDGDYSDSIDLAKRLSQLKGLTYEAGARNIARRDGLAMVMVDAASTIKEMPHHYFQAVGSGTGAIAAYEAAHRLRGDGRFGMGLPVFHLSQNLPVAPIYNAWKAKRREIIPDLDLPKTENVLDLVYARVLSNRYPPYSEAGGVYDVLRDTGGVVYGIETRDAKKAKSLFQRLEGIDILPAAAVAVASLIKASEEGGVSKEDKVLLNITGGGSQRLRKDRRLSRIESDHIISKDISDVELEALII